MSEVRNIRCYFDDNGTFEDIDFQDIINLVGENNLLTTLKDVESKLIEAMEMVKDTNLTYETAQKIIREFRYLGTSSKGGINWITNLNFPSRLSNHTPATYTIKGDQTFYINSTISNDRWTGRGTDEFRNAMETFVESLKEQNAYIQSSCKRIKSSTVYSDSFDEMIQKDFTYKGKHYTWNDLDCVYYNDNGDEEDFFMEIPEGAITSAKKLIESDYMDCIDYPSRMFKGARFENPNGVICEIVKVEPENNYVLYKFNDKFPEDTTIDGIIALLKHNSYYPIASNTPGKVIREEEDDVGYIIQLVELDDGRYKVCDNNGTEDICNTYDEARKMFYMYLG